VFAAILVAAILRICAAFRPDQQILLHGSAAAWTIAFLGFAVLFGRMVMRPRLPAGVRDGGLLARLLPLKGA
jgi:uncharacterized protein involved in response to NO